MQGKSPSFRAQSAMEYLMTYGWAILITAVVLGALFGLGLFSGQGLSTACIATPGYLCSAPALLTSGNLTVQFGQNNGATFYNVGLACTAQVTPAGFPSPSNAMVEIDYGLAAPSTQPASPLALSSNYNSLTLLSGGSFAITGLKCFDNTNNALVQEPIGTSYTATLWLNYTPRRSLSGPWYTEKVASLVIKVT